MLIRRAKGAAIEIKNKAEQRTIKVKSDLKGKFYYGRLKPGSYVIHVFALR